MATTFPGQHPDETIDFVFRQHPVVMRKHLIYGLVVFTIGAVPLSFWPLDAWAWWVFGIGFLAGLAVFGYRFLSWYFSIYIISSERLIQIRQKGLFDRSVQDVAHTRIQSVNYEIKGFQATLFKYGTILVQTYVGDLNLKYIHHPEEVQQHLNKLIRELPVLDPRGVEEGTHGEEASQQFEAEST